MRNCFVISPIGQKHSKEWKHAGLVLNYIIRPALEQDGGFVVQRADESGHAGMITVHVVNSILEADLVVADLSFLNANVFYELGLRHSTKRPTIHLASTETVLPFDNADHRTIFYDIGDWQTHEAARQTLKDYATAVFRPEYLVTNPVTLAEAHHANRRQRQVIESIGNWVHVLQQKLDTFTEEPPAGHITREYFRRFTTEHRGQILEIVQAIRRRIEDPASRPAPSEVPQVEDVLMRLGAIEQMVLSNRLPPYMPDGALVQ